MSLPVTTRLAGPYSCNGALVAFDFVFKVFAEADLRVVLTDSAAAETDLVITTNYTVSLNADQENDPGGTVTTASTYATGYKITIVGDLAYGQPTVLTNLGGFFPKTIEYAMDRLGILIQQLKESVGRAVRVPVSSGASGDLPAPSAGMAIGWNATEDGFVNLAATGSLAVTSFAETLLDDTTAAAARTTLGAAASGANSDITSLSAITGDIALSGNGAIEEARANITQHATTMNFWAGPNVLDGAGSAVTITACVNAPQAGARRKFYPLAATVLTHGATFDIDGNVNQTAAAGDCWEIVAKTTSTYKVHVTKEDGTAIVSTFTAIPVRQTVLGGPVTSAGLPDFLPTTSVNLNLTTQNVSATAPNVLSVTASNGNSSDATGAANRVGFSTSNLTWTGLTASRAAATPNYLFVDIDSVGVMTTGFTILAPVYQWGGTYSTTNLQNTFNIQEMTMKVGDGAAVTQKWRVFVGEAATDGTTVISTVAYAYQGRYMTAWANTVPSGPATASHNIGVTDLNLGFHLKNLTTEAGYVADEIVTQMLNNNYSPVSHYHTRNGMKVGYGTTASVATAGTSNSTLITLANWAYRFIASRAW